MRGEDPVYNPAQRQVIDLLGRAEGPHASVPFPDAVAERCYQALHEGLADVAGALDHDQPRYVSKHDLAMIHTCETHATLPSAPFTWSVPVARGAVVHKAIELSVHWRGEAAPGHLVDEAIASLIGSERGPGPWLATLCERDRAELTAGAADLVAKFAEAFPPLKREWWPVTETRVHAQLFDGALVLSGTCDLLLGRPDPRAPRRVIIDFKTGMPARPHREDLRYYALLETLKNGVPPRLVASYYLDLAHVDRDRLQTEAVTPALLEAAVARVVDGIRIRLALERAEREPRRRAGPTCRWCPLLPGCPDGQAQQAGALPLG